MDECNIQFGKNSAWILPKEEGIACIRAPQPRIDSIASAVNAALASPLEFPAFDQALVAGDQLALAVDPQCPSLVEVVSATVRWFCEHGTPAANMRVVLAGEGGWDVGELTIAIAEQVGFPVSVEQHDFDDADKSSYVAANEASDPIYLNRSLVDADVVIPITCARPLAGLDYFGAFSLFPLFSNRATRGAFYSLPRLEDSTERDKLLAWADQAAWWLGVLVGIQVIPAANDRVATVLAGQLQPVEEAAQRSLAEHWSCPANEASDLVVALLDNSVSSLSWLNVARVLSNALRIVTPQGTIVLATQLSQAIGKGLGRLRDPHQSPAAISKKLAVDSSDDALTAAVILNAIASNHVYLISNLRSETVESLGLGVISDADQLVHLIRQHTSCTVIQAAQHRTLEPCHT